MRGILRVPSSNWHTSALAALLVILLAGCAAPWPFPQPTLTPDPKLPDTQQVFHPLEVGASNGDVYTLDPARILYSEDYQIAQLIFPQLVTLDEQGKPVDWAAERHEVSSDGLTYTFHLHNGMVWSDGTPIDALAFAYSINRALDPCAGSDVAYYLYSIKGAQAFKEGRCPPGATKSQTSLIGSSLLIPDPLTLQIRLERPAGNFLAALTNSPSWAVPQALVERYTTPTTDPERTPPVTSTWTDHLTENGGLGGNLYRLGTYDARGAAASARLVLERNERFWRQKPLLRRIEYTLYREASVAWDEFKVVGKGDVGFPPLANTADPIGSIGSEIAVARALKEVTVQQTPSLAYSYFRIDWTLAPFDDARVRQAFSLALDRQAIAHDIYKDTYQPTIHLVPEGMPGYHPDLTNAAGRQGKDALAADLATARSLAAAYAAEKCGGSYARCAPIRLLFPRNLTGLRGRAHFMALTQWQTAFPGWVMTWDDGPHLQVQESPRYHLAGGGWDAEYPDPQNFLTPLWTTNAEYNRGFVSIPQVDALCAQADGMSDLSTRIPLYQQAEQLLVTQGAAIPYLQPLFTYVVRSHVVGWRIAPTGQTPLSVWQGAYIKR